MTGLLLFLFNIGYFPALAFWIGKSAPVILPTLRSKLTYWLVTASVCAAMLTAADRWWPYQGAWLSALIALIVLWWRWKRPDRAIRSLGAKSKARIEALAARMPKARVPVPVGAA